MKDFFMKDFFEAGRDFLLLLFIMFVWVTFFRLFIGGF